MFTNYDHGRFSVIDDGTLVIESVVKEDAGEYVCKGLSIAGSAYAKARLEVRGMTICQVLSFYRAKSMQCMCVAWYMLQPAVCLSHAGVVLNWLNRSRCCLTQRLSLGYLTLL